MSFDPMAVAIDWLDAYRRGDIDQILGLYDEQATVECACDGKPVISGTSAIAAYWRHRIDNCPALSLEDIQPYGERVALSYWTAEGTVAVAFEFNDAGKIRRTQCGPAVPRVS